MKSAFVWNDALMGDFRKLWHAGLSVDLIGREIGVSRNSIIGKARRLGLPRRDNPIKVLDVQTVHEIRRLLGEGRTHRQIAKDLGVSKGSVCNYGDRKNVVGYIKRAKGGHTQNVTDNEVRAAVGLPPTVLSIVPYAEPHSHFKRCQWFEGDTLTDDHKCGEPTKPGFSYCEAHCKRAFLPKSKARGWRAVA